MTLLRQRPKKKAAPPSNSHVGEVLCCAFAPARGWVVSGGWDGEVIQWDPAGRIERRWRAGDKPITAVAVSPQEDFILTGGMDGFLCRWDVHTLDRKSMFLAHTRPISEIVFAPDGQSFATSAWDRTVGVWPLDRERIGRTLKGHQDIVSGCAFMPDGRRLVSWSYDGTARMWEVESATELRSWSASLDRVLAGAVSPDGRWIATSGREGAVVLWDAANAQESGRYSFREGEVRCCFFSSDAELLATVNTTGELLRHAVPGFPSRSAQANIMHVQCAVGSHSRDQVALGTESGQVHILAVDNLGGRPWCVTPREVLEDRPSFLGKLFGRSRMTAIQRVSCPQCKQNLEVVRRQATMQCAGCRREMKVNDFALER